MKAFVVEDMEDNCGNILHHLTEKICKIMRK